MFPGVKLSIVPDILHVCATVHCRVYDRNDNNRRCSGWNVLAVGDGTAMPPAKQQPKPY